MALFYIFADLSVSSITEDVLILWVDSLNPHIQPIVVCWFG